MNKEQINVTEVPKRKRYIAVKILICFVSVSFLFLGGVSLYAANFVFANLNTTTITKDKEELGITDETTSHDQITNIALYGLDNRDNSFSGRSDSIMILSIDQLHGKVKLTSILRDTRVYMGDGYYNTSSNWDKINHAYNLGPEFAIKTLNQNFNLDIEDYITVNFGNLEKIINAVGGVDIELSSAEISTINQMVTSNDYINSGAGIVHLNGAQALAYSRIRSLDGDNYRAMRQQEVLSAAINGIAKKPAMEYSNLINQLSGMTQTSLDLNKIMSYVPFVVGGFSIETTIMPNELDNPGTGYFENGGWMWDVDLDKATDRIKEFIYEGEQGT